MKKGRGTKWLIYNMKGEWYDCFDRKLVAKLRMDKVNICKVIRDTNNNSKIIIGFKGYRNIIKKDA